MICALLVGCTDATTFFPDKGTGTWVAMDGTPALGYRAIWSDVADDVYAVGTGGAAHYDGSQWETLNALGPTTYRAVWGRSERQVWIGGDDAMFTRAVMGWEPQQLSDDGEPITHYSVLDIQGDDQHEYALVQSGGQVLLFMNHGTTWETLYWSSTKRLPLDGRLVVLRDGSLLVAGDGAMVLCTPQRDLPLWDAVDASGWYSQPVLPVLRGLSGGAGFWAGAGRDAVVIQDDDNDDFTLLVDQRDAIAPRSANDLYATSSSRMFVVGSPVVLRSPDPVSGVSKSPVEACDDHDCVLEPVFPPTQIATFTAVTGGLEGAVFATSDQTVFRRAAK
ncbi:MAG TPA: hypothetical protein VGM90_24765 [Kofleriaceae bacterium]|jgi:hypothetical protein